MYRTCVGFSIIVLLLNASRVAAQPIAKTELTNDPRDEICQLIEAAAKANALPIDFFARLIWQESRFRADEVGPVTRTGQRAQGIAQFMPGTAVERQVLEPFNPIEALPKSGEFLAELRSEFGNLGLAAAAYNAGPQRVRDYLAGARDLPTETRKYVQSVTGRPIEEWAILAKTESTAQPSNGSVVAPSPISCRALVASLERTTNRMATAMWQGRKFPSWCKGLRHPNSEECGPVHLIGPATDTTSVALSRSRVHLARSSSH